MKLSSIFESILETVKPKVEYRFEHVDSHSGQDNYELGMYVDDDIMGMIQYVLYDGKITVSDIIVRPEFRRKGFGSMMMKAMKQNHPDYEYVPSMKTDLGAKFKHKDIADLHSIPEGSTYIGHKIPVGDIFLNDNLNGGSDGPNWDLMRTIDVYKDDATFEQEPVKTVDVNSIVPTQKFLNKDNLKRVNNVGNNTGAYLVEYNGLFYVIDGHHRIANEIMNSASSIKAYVHTL